MFGWAALKGEVSAKTKSPIIVKGHKIPGLISNLFTMHISPSMFDYVSKYKQPPVNTKHERNQFPDIGNIIRYKLIRHS